MSAESSVVVALSADWILLCVGVPLVLIGTLLNRYGSLLWQLAAISTTGTIIAVMLAIVPPYFVLRVLWRRHRRYAS